MQQPTKLSDIIAILQALNPELPVQSFQAGKLRHRVEQVRRNDIAALYTKITPIRYVIELEVLQVEKFERDLRGAL